MCIPGLDPITLATVLASTAATAGGAVYNNQIQQQALQQQERQDKQAAQMANAAREDEALRQKAMERQQAEQVAKALTKANPTQALLEAQQTAQAPANEIAQPAYNEAIPSPVQNKVVDDHARPTTQAREAQTQETLAAMALLSALDDRFAQSGEAIQRAGSNIQTTGSFRQGSINANARETAIEPGAVTPSDSILGDLMLIGGQLGARSAGSRIGAGEVGRAITGRRGTNPSRLVLASGGLY